MEKLKKNLAVAIEAARQRGEPLGHCIFSGPPGLGKTTLAHIMAHEMGVDVRVTSGPVLDKPGDLAGLLTGLKRGDILFIDEIHRLSPVIEESLYPAMEDFRIEIVTGVGAGASGLDRLREVLRRVVDAGPDELDGTMRVRETGVNLAGSASATALKVSSIRSCT